MVEDEQNTLWLSWRDDQFLAQVGFLSTMNALAYFSKSPFFDGTLDQQSMLSSYKTKRLYVFMSLTFPWNHSNGSDYNVVVSFYRTTGGGDTSYILQDAQPPHLFVVRREQKTRAGDMPTAAYYIIDGTVYQSPSLYSVFHSRIVRCFVVVVVEVYRCYLDVVIPVQRRCSFKIAETLEMLRQDLNPIDGTLSKRPKDMYQTLKRLEALQQKEYASNTETFARSDHIIASVLHQQAMALHPSKDD